MNTISLVAIVSLSGAADGSVAIANLVQGIVLRVLNEHRGNAPICMIDSKRLVESQSFMWLIASHDRRVSLWKSNEAFDLCQLIDWLTFSAPAFAPDGSAHDNQWQSYPPSLARFIDANLLMYVGYGIEKSIQVYNLDSKQIVRSIPLSQWCSSFDLSSIESNNDDEQRLIALGTKDRLVQLKDYTQGTFQDFIGNSDTLSNVKFVRTKSNHFLISTASNEISVWKVLLN